MGSSEGTKENQNDGDVNDMSLRLGHQAAIQSFTG
jgi:hypothetical protein